jgi:hypothetical protein
MPLVDITNIEAGRGGAKASGKPAAAAPAHPADSASEQEGAAAQGQGQEEPLLERSFRKQLSFHPEDASEVASAGIELPEEEVEELAAEESHASDASTACASGEGSQLDSPMAAFAAAKARLTRSNSEAGTLISATLQQVAGLRERVAAAAAGDTAGSSGSTALCLPRQQQPRSLQAVGAAGGGICGSPLPAMTVLQKRNLLLKERLHSTLQLCQTLHEQVEARRCGDGAAQRSTLGGSAAPAWVFQPMPCFPQARVPLQSDKFTTHSTVPPPWLPGCCVCLQNQGNSEKVAQLWADNQKLNRSLQSARVR